MPILALIFVGAFWNVLQLYDEVAHTSCDEESVYGLAIVAMDTEEHETAVRLLEHVFRRDPACLLPELGAAAYWLGQLYLDRGDEDLAFRTWSQGFEAHHSSSQMDLRLLDRQIAALVRDRSEPAASEATDLAHQLIQAACEPASSREQPVLARRIAQMVPLIEPKSGETFARRLDDWDGSSPLAGEDCQKLITWWEEQNPLPASEVNERLIEHFERVHYAEDAFAFDRELTGFDDRGTIYVQYGAPGSVMSLRYNDLRFAREVFRFGVNVSRGDFAEHEIWSYHVAGADYTFIFIRNRTGYRMGTSLDLLPVSFRYGFDHSPRGQNRAVSALAAMRWIYEKLAVHHSGYGTVYREIDAYDARQEALRSLRRLVPGREQSEDPSQRVYDLDHQVTGAVGSANPPSHFIQSLIAQTSAQERELLARREAHLPVVLSDITGTDRLVLDGLRTARLLQRDGSTRLIIFWRDGVTAYDDRAIDSELGLRHRARLVSTSARPTDRELLADTMYAAGHSDRPVSRLDIEVRKVLPGTSLQVDRLFDGGGWLGSGRATLGTIEPLTAIPGQLEVSDLIPFEVDDLSFARTRMQEEPGIEGIDPFPDHYLRGQEALGAYFEVYIPDAMSRDRDIILMYEIVKKHDGRILRGPRTETTVLPFRRVSIGERLPAAFFVDRATWAGADEIELVVTVTDDLTGAEVVRRLTYSVQE